MHKYIEVVLAFSIICAVFVSQSVAEERLESLVKVEIERREELNGFIDMKITITDRRENYVKLIVTQDQLKELESMGYKVEIVTPDLSHELDWLKALPDRAEYHNYSELVEDFTALVDSYPSITELDTFGFSVQGRALLALKITDNPDVREREPEVRIVGCHHGDEAISVEVPISLAHHICGEYGSNPEITNLVDNREIWIIPMLNPDGLMAGTRRNANWVDLNRDYGYMWEGHGGSPSPYSQPETQALFQFSQEHNFSLSLSHHSGAEYVNYLWNYTPIRTQDDSLIVELSEEYGSYSGYPVTNGWDWYEVHGDCNDYSYGIDGDMDWTIEISYTKTPPASQIDYYCGLNRDAQLYIIKKAGQGVGGFVLDAETGDTIRQAMVNVEEIDWPVYVDPHYGDYQRVLMPGIYTLTAFANGYQSQTISGIQVFEDSTTEITFSLQPGGSIYGHKFVEATVTDPYNSYNNYTLTPHALGPVDGKFLSIGVNGRVIIDMGFQTRIADTTGCDFTIYEGDDGEEEGYSAYISNSWDGPWVSVGAGVGTQSFDIGTVGFSQARYVKIVDDGDGSSSGQYAGFDLESIRGKPLSGPCLVMDSLEIDDSAGNNDGKIDPGETAGLYFTFCNEGVDTAVSTDGKLIEFGDCLQIIDSLGAFGDIPPGEQRRNDADPFVVSAEPETPWHQKVNLGLVMEEEGGYVDTFCFSVTVGSGGDFLILDLDPNRSSGPLVKEALDSLQYRGAYDTLLAPYFSELRDFKSIFVCLGVFNDAAQIPNGSPEAESLENYLAVHGGNAYMEGGDIWYYAPRHGGYDFCPLFGIFASVDGFGDLTTINGKSGTFAEGFSFPYTGENNSIDRIVPIDSGFALFANADPYYTCGIANSPGDYRTVGVSFEFGGLPEGGDRLALADSIMHFFGIYSNYPPEPFSLLQPPSGDTLPIPVLLDWQDAHDPDLGDTVLYRLVISRSSTFLPESTATFDSLTQSQYSLETIPQPGQFGETEMKPSWTIPGLMQTKDSRKPLGRIRSSIQETYTATYYWKVIAFDGEGNETPANETFILYLSLGRIFVRGDGNADGLIMMSDATFILRYLYVPESPSPPCMDAADTDDDGSVQMSDAINVLRHLYIPGSPPPPAPYPECGSDPTSDDLNCNSHPCM